MPHSILLLLVIVAFITTVVPKIPVLVPLVLIEVALMVSLGLR